MTLHDLESQLYRLNRRLSVIVGATAVLSIVFVLATAFLPSSSNAVAADSSGEQSHTSKVIRLSDSQVEALSQARPIFRSRNVKPVTEVNEAGRYSLRGIAKRKDGLRAFVHDAKTQRTITVGKGAKLGNVFEVLEVTQEGVLLKRGAEEFLLKNQ
jgi:hypothetical protein